MWMFQYLNYEIEVHQNTPVFSPVGFDLWPYRTVDVLHIMSWQCKLVVTGIYGVLALTRTILCLSVSLSLRVSVYV